MNDQTMTFSLNQEKELELKQTLTIIYDALVGGQSQHGDGVQQAH